MARGVIFIGADYRLLHPLTGHDEIEDVKTLFRFLSKDISRHFPSGVALDSTRLAVAGFSAGGYIGRLACLYAEPRPRVFLSCYGMGGDMILDHWLTPGRAAMPSVSFLIQKEDLSRITDEPVANATLFFDPKRGWLDDEYGRSVLWVWWWQNGEHLDHLTGDPGFSRRLQAIPHDQREANIPADLTPLFPQLHIDSKFPPTMLLHGDADTAVPHAESARTYEQLQAAGVRSAFYTIHGAEHGFMLPGQGKEAPEMQAQWFPKAFEFLMAEIA